MIGKTNILFSKLFSRKSALIILILIVFIIFRASIWEYYNEKIVGKYLSTVKSHWIIDCTFIFLAIFTLIVTIHLVLIKKRISNYLFYLLLVLFVLFFYCRIFSSKYFFEPYFWFSPLKYVDYIFILFGSILLLKISDWVNGFEKPKYFNSAFYIDFPINVRKDDVYRRADFALLLAKKIQSELGNKEAGALAIGINGPWGSGKTSFSNLIKENIQQNNRIIINFNPWRSSSSSKIIEDFFELLIHKLREFDPSLSSELNAYASTLTKIHENTITKTTEIISDYFFGRSNKNESYYKINESILRLNKQIIIFIDDLDRLDINECIEVLRLVRNTASFNNLVYVVAYDKGYVLEAVKKINPHNYRSFLEKIFQFEFLLPSLDKSSIRNYLKEVLIKGLGSELRPVINGAVDFVGISGKNITSKVIKNNRDILRFSNSLIFEIVQIKDEVNFIDFYLIQLLKLKFTSVYIFLADHFELFFINDKGKIRLRVLSEKYINDEYLNTLKLLDESRKEPVDTETKKSLFEEYIKGNTSDGYSDFEKDTINEIVELLLREKDLRINSASKDYKSFVYSKNFNIYFNIKLLDSSLSAKEFEEYRYDDYQKYRDLIFNWIEKGRISDVKDRLEKIIDFSSKNEWENHLKILIAIAKYQYKHSGVYGINYREIIDVLKYPDNPQGIGFIFFDNREDYLNYVWGIFKEAPDPYVIEGNILFSASNKQLQLPFDEALVEEQLLNYFKQYCLDHKEVTDELRELHNIAVKKSDKVGADFDIHPEAEKIFRDHFLQYLKGSQLSGFIRHAEPGTDLFRIDAPWVSNFFPDPMFDNLEDYLERSESIKIEREQYEEFLIFYDKFKSNNYSAVDFIFNYLQPSLWSGGTKSKPT